MNSALKIYFPILMLLSFTATAQNEKATRLFNKGVEMSEKNDYNNAIINFTDAIRISPTYKDAYFKRGLCYFLKEEYILARNDFTEVIRIDPDNVESLIFRGGAYIGLRENDLAISDLNEALRLDPQSINAYLFRGIAYLKNTQYNLAIEDFSKTIKSDSKNVLAISMRGIAYTYMGQFDPAIQDINEAIQINPQIAEVYTARAIYYVRRGLYEMAISDMKKSLEINPDNADCHINLVSMYIRKLNFSKAKECYDQYQSKGLISIIQKDEKFTFYNFYLTAALENIPGGLFDDALANLNTAIKEYKTVLPNKNELEASDLLNSYTDVLALKGYVLEKLNRNAEAKDVYEQALTINKEQPDVKDALVVLYRKLTEIVVMDKTPPVIELINPQPSRSFDIESDNAPTQIIGRAKDESGIKMVKINGKTIDKVEEDGLFITEFTLKGGTNSIIITATDKRGNESNSTFIITTAVAKKKELDIPPLVDAMPKYYAILIAENDYLDNAIPDLQNPIKDAKELKTILESQYNFSLGNFDTLYNRSREDIMQVIVQRCNTLTENDNLVIFYAGHGTAEKDNFGNIDGYWIPVSARKGLTATYISAEDINRAIKRSKAKHILLLADACFSGAFTRNLPGDANKITQRQYKVPSRKVMASGNLEPVPDNSVFLYYLKKSLSENTEKYISAKDLFDSFYKAIINNTENLPQYAAIKNVGDEGGEFVFIKK